MHEYHKAVEWVNKANEEAKEKRSIESSCLERYFWRELRLFTGSSKKLF